MSTGKATTGRRTVKAGWFLGGELLRWKSKAPSRHHYRLVFPAARGTPRGKDNLRKRVLAPVVDEANRARLEAGRPPLPPGIAPEWLRRTFIALQIASGRDLRVVQRQADVDLLSAARIQGQVAQIDFAPTATLLDRFCAESAGMARAARRVRFTSLPHESRSTATPQLLRYVANGGSVNSSA